MLLEVFCYCDRKTLSICARVCKKWREAAYRPLLWRNVIPSLSVHEINYGTVVSFKQRHVKSLSLDCDRMSYKDLLDVLTQLNIELVTLICHHYDLAALLTFPYELFSASLTHLALIYVPKSTNFMTDKSLKTILTPLLNLQQLILVWDVDNPLALQSIEGSPEETDVHRTVLKSLPRLRDLQVSRCNFNPVYDPTEGTIHNLQSLTLFIVFCTRDPLEGIDSLSNEISLMPGRFPSLQHLHVVYCDSHFNFHDTLHVSFQNLRTEFQSTLYRKKQMDNCATQGDVESARSVIGSI